MASEGDDGQQADAGVLPVWSSRAGQVALVTGGSGWLGLAIATAMAAAGSDVVLASRSAERCEQAAAGVSAQTGRRVTGRPCDVTSEADVAALVDGVLTDHGRLDVLVTSAGVQARGTLDQLSVGALRACLDVNVVGTWLACREAARPMRSACRNSHWQVGRARRARWRALLLTDPHASYLTGAVLSVDGGWTAH